MRLWRFIQHLMWYRARLSAAHFCVRLIFDLFLLLPGLILRRFFNAITLPTTPLTLLLILLSAWIAAVLVHIPFDMVIARLRTSIQYICSGLLQINLVRELYRRPGAIALPYSSGQALSILRDDIDYIADYIHWPSDLLSYALFAIIAIGIMFSINALITIGVLVPIVIVIIMTKAASARLENYRTQHRQASEQVTDALGETFSAVQAIQLAGKEQAVGQHISYLNTIRMREALKDLLFDKLLEAVYRNTLYSATGIVLLLAAHAIAQGTFTVGDFSLFMAYLPYLTEFTYYTGISFTRYVQVDVSRKRMHTLIPGTPEYKIVQVTPLDTSTPRYIPLECLRVSQLTFVYPHSDNGIRDISFTLMRGELLVITGPMSAGKTTLLRTLLGLLPKQKGNIFWNSTYIAESANFFIPPHAAYTSQVPQLFSATLKENILMGLPEDTTNFTNALHLALLEEDIAFLPEGLNTRVGPNGVQLSGGQVQRTAIARMLVRTPELLVLDDISSALDSATEKQIWHNIHVQNYTCIAVSDRSHVLEKATQIITLKEGLIHEHRVQKVT